MVSTVNINPLLTTTAAGGFSVQSDGLFQGTAMDDPAVRNALAGGYLAADETIPMWGGVGIYEFIAPTPGHDYTMGGQVGRATSMGNTAKGLTGFSVFNQAHAWITSPQSRVPLAASGMTVPFYRLGSGARIAVQIDPSLVTTEGSLITTQVTWDLNAQVLAPLATAPSFAITSLTWNNTNGGQGVVVAPAATNVAGIGEFVTFIGAVNAGTGGNNVVNNTPFVVVAYTDSQHFTVAMPAAPGVIGAITGSVGIVANNVALPCKILQIQLGNSKTVVFNPATGFANWNPSGNAALIQI
jgi:hypothetical protein